MAFSEVIPYLYYEDADAALDWLERVLEFGPSTRWRLGAPVTQEADILIGESRVSITHRPPGVGHGAGALLIVHVDDIDAYRARVSAADSNAPISSVQKQPYGPLTFTVVDPWGYRWNFWQGESDPPTDS
ncbi:VOC family protein [Leifsonia sp. fls2-241-R2A-40a]|uniref:VOC family protein n=1 Tax=Leifsonia sp. fls2-241-R2A-40a TaxID=3040290 RepID=UPI00254D4101|nr:VOC family protein [Leifsonia sp. fls2-241-R2A-40a]